MAQMTLAKHDHMIKAIPPDRADCMSSPLANYLSYTDTVSASFRLFRGAIYHLLRTALRGLS